MIKKLELTAEASITHTKAFQNKLGQFTPNTQGKTPFEKYFDKNNLKEQ